MRGLFTSIAAIGIAAMLVIAPANAGETFKIGWSHYTGWEPIGVLQSSGILAKHAKANGVDIEIVFFGDFIDSISQYNAKKLNGIAATNMDILAIAGVGGRHSTSLVVGDYSNGNDGLVLKGVKNIADIKGKTVRLVEYSVSHYLLARCLEKAGLTIDDVTTENVTDADIPAIVQSGDVVVAVSWNPMLMTIRNQDGVTIPCTSAEFPGHIIDMVLVGDEFPAAARKAFADAWFELMAKIAAGDKATIAELADQAGGSVADFNAQLKTTKMFFTRAEAKAFTESKDLPAIMKKVVDFSFANGVYDGPKTVEEIGVKFTDGTTLYDPKNVMLTFSSEYMK